MVAIALVEVYTSQDGMMVQLGSTRQSHAVLSTHLVRQGDRYFGSVPSVPTNNRNPNVLKDTCRQYWTCVIETCGFMGWKVPQDGVVSFEVCGYGL